MKIEDAERVIIEWFNGISSSTNPKSFGAVYGYDIYIRSVIGWHLMQLGIDPEREGYRKREELSPVFYAAAWELCRRGILRPGVRIMGAQATDDGSGGNGYSVTPFGRKWIEEDDKVAFVPAEPGRLPELLKPFRTRFGPGFYDRSQEAVRCYKSHIYLACCAMCGAAAESILLATAIAKNGDSEKVLKMYLSASGRSRVENMIVGQAKNYLKREFNSFLPLLKYWRDESAHGKSSTISDNEAYISLTLLLRFAMFIDENWNELTQK